MQTEVPALPVVCSDGYKRLTRKIGQDPDIATASIKNQSACKNAAILLAKRKQLHPLLGGPYYKNSARIYTVGDPVKYSEKNPVGQRVLSAKMLRVKQLQNQLTDAHYHLNELANENRLLKALQKRQDSALQRYEGTNAELPRIINSHHEELRVLQTKYKKLKAQHKDTCDLLKEKENELHTLQAQNKHLLQLSKDRNLSEREKLQRQVSDLNHRIKRQNETIQMLHRKLALESKSLKHQLNNEVAKNKLAQRHLNKTMEKLKALEDLLDNREKKLYYNGQLSIFNKRKNMVSQSLTNLADDGSNPTNLQKTVAANGDVQDQEIPKKSLPTLAEYDSNVNPKESETSTSLTMDLSSVSQKTETMASLEQIRKFRLQKSPLTQKLSARDRLRKRINETEFEIAENNGDPFENLYDDKDQQDLSDRETDLSKSEENLEKRKEGATYKLPRQLRQEFGYPINDSETEDENIHCVDQDQNRDADRTNASKELHARLTIGKLSDVTEGRGSNHKKEEVRSFTEEELDRFINEKLKFKRESVMQDIVNKKTYSKAECKAEMQQLKAATGISESDSETDSASDSTKEQERCDFVLKNAPDDSENENFNHPIEDFLKFDVHNRSDSESEADRPTRKTEFTRLRSSDDKTNVSDAKASLLKNKNDDPKPSDNKSESSKHRLMDITKSWSELQEKIMRERETSESQIKALESELEDGIILERRNAQRIDAEEAKKLLTCNTKQLLSLTNKDNLKENIEQKLLEIDFKQGKRFEKKRKNSISLGNMNLGIEQSEKVGRNELQSSNKVESNDLESGDMKAEEKTLEKDQNLRHKLNSLTSYSGVSDNFTSIENELSDIDTAQAALQNMVSETKRQINESMKMKSKPPANATAKIDGQKKLLNNSEQQQLNESNNKKDKISQKKYSYKQEEMSAEAKMINYNKEKLLAAMKAIDNNENVEFLDLQKSQRGNGSNRSQITENLYRGVPTHAKKKDDLIKELFGDGKGDTKSRNGCTKMH